MVVALEPADITLMKVLPAAEACRSGRSQADTVGQGLWVPQVGLVQDSSSPLVHLFLGMPSQVVGATLGWCTAGAPEP